MARRTMQELLRSSVKDATALGAEHRKIVESLGKSPAIEPESNQEVQLKGTTEWLYQKVEPHEPKGTTSRLMRYNQKVQPEGTTTRCDYPAPPFQEPNLVKQKPRDLTKIQKLILDHLKQQGPHITDKGIISQSLGIPPLTVRNTLIRLTDLGLVSRRRVGQGVRVEVVSQCAHGTTNRYNQTVQPDDGSPTPYKIDREDLNLSISLEVIQTSWPNLARSGFGVEQVDQIVANLTATGKPTSRIIQGLDHIEFELANDQMVDKEGQKVSDACSWAFRALAQNGYYRRPKGYVSPEEQAAKDAEEEARAVIAARQKAEQVRFEAWRDGLSPDELTKALKGHPGGPKDAWLKTVWKKMLAKG